MRRKVGCNIMLRERRCRAKNQFGAANGLGDIGRHKLEFDVMPTSRVLDQDARSGGTVRGDRACIAAPKSDLMALQGKVAGGRERAVAAAEDRDLQRRSPKISFSLKCCTLPSAVRGKSSTNTNSRGTLKRASRVSMCACNALASV